jgi:ATP-dependent Clp protease ATP-binding subunit ClpC
MFERFTVSARRAVVLSQGEAHALNHDHVGPGHLLLGAAAAGDTTAGAVLTSLGVELEALRDQVTAKYGREENEPSGHIPFSADGKKVFEHAFRESLDSGHDYIGTGHILLGLLRDAKGDAAALLSALGVQHETVRQAVTERHDAAGDEPTEP